MNIKSKLSFYLNSCKFEKSTTKIIDYNCSYIYIYSCFQQLSLKFLTRTDCNTNNQLRCYFKMYITTKLLTSYRLWLRNMYSRAPAFGPCKNPKTKNPVDIFGRPDILLSIQIRLDENKFKLGPHTVQRVHCVPFINIVKTQIQSNITWQ